VSRGKPLKLRIADCGIKKTLTLNYRQKKNFSLAEAAESAEEKRIQDTGIRSQAMGFRFQASGFRIQDSGPRIGVFDFWFLIPES